MRNSCWLPGSYEIALCDLALSLGALALARLSAEQPRLDDVMDTDWDLALRLREPS